MTRDPVPDSRTVAVLGQAVDDAMSPVTDDLRAQVLARLRHELGRLRAELGLPDRGHDGAERVAEGIMARLPAALE